MAALDWSQCPAVESIPGKVRGAWIAAGLEFVAGLAASARIDAATATDIQGSIEALRRAQPVSLQAQPSHVPLRRR